MHGLTDNHYQTVTVSPLKGATDCDSVTVQTIPNSLFQAALAWGIPFYEAVMVY